MIMTKTVGELCKQIKGIYNLNGSADTVITGISSDSRQIEAGYLFVCISGVHVDGAAFAAQAVEKGAVAVLTTKHLDLPKSTVQIQVPDIHHALEDMVPFFYDYPGKKMRMIGVTGTNGKTTTTHIIAHILRAAGYHVGVIGTIHALIDDEELPIHNTTPDVVELQHFLALMQEKGMTHVVMEVSSHALALNRVAGIEYDTAVFTNLTQDHLDFHKTMENYVAAKAKLFQSLTAADHVKENKTAVVNIDDPWSKDILNACHCKVLTYGVEKDADLKGSNLKVELKKSSFDVVGPFVNVHLNMNITGLFNVYNTLAAIGAVLYCMAYPLVSPTMGSLPGLKAFIAAVFGGIGILPGAMIGGFVMGIAESLTKSYISSQMSDAVVYGILIIMLLVKPTGLLGKRASEKV